MPTPHCDCVDKCCHCHYEQKNPPAEKTRRFAITMRKGKMENCYRSKHGDFLIGAIPAKDVTQIDPITWQQIIVAFPYLQPFGLSKAKESLRELGIEVED